MAQQVFADIRIFAEEKRIPIGVNVESVSIRKEEIDASCERFTRLSPMIAEYSTRARNLPENPKPPGSCGPRFHDICYTYPERTTAGSTVRTFDRGAANVLSQVQIGYGIRHLS